MATNSEREFGTFLNVRVSETDKLDLLRLSRTVGEPGNLSATVRHLIKDAAQAQPRRRRQSVSVAAEAASAK